VAAPTRPGHLPAHGGDGRSDHVSAAVRRALGSLRGLHHRLLADSFALVIEEPALAGYRRINIYRRGYRGSSGAEGLFTISDQAADVVGVLDALNLPRAHIVGHSSGGSVALQLAADAPERVASLVLIEPVGLQLAPPDIVSFAAQSDFGLVQRAAELYAAGDREGAVESFFTFAFGDDWRRRYFDPIPGGYEQTVADADGLFAIDMPGMLAGAYGPDELRAIDRPIMMNGWRRHSRRT
jgi:pimeloyl-ACP methyl ester carboxylesterase